MKHLEKFIDSTPPNHVLTTEERAIINQAIDAMKRDIPRISKPALFDVRDFVFWLKSNDIEAYELEWYRND